jgi:hypothetical protein
MENFQARVEALVSAPAGRAFLMLAAGSGIAASVISTPRVSLEIAALALGEVSLWRTDRASVFAELDRAPTSKLQRLACAVLTSPEAQWWFEPLQRSRQMWLSREGGPPLATQLVTPTEPPTSWERYAQKPEGGFFTSTLIEGTSSVHADLAVGMGDYADRFQAGPRACWWLVARADARVFEIDGPDAWHRLCVQYGAQGEDGRLIPDWAAVAHHLDAVHLTLGGLLTAEQVRVASSAGWSRHDKWDLEQTLWLRWRFEATESLPELPQQLEPRHRVRRLLEPPSA